MKYLLDTNAVIHLMKGEEPLSSKIMAHHPSEFVVSGFTEAELLFGVENSGSSHRAGNEMKVQLTLAPFQILYQDQVTSWAYGKIKAHLVSKRAFQSRNEIDLFIASTAVAHGLVLVTQNAKDFKAIPNLQLKDWS
jgi:tRNA(fMet)-specific endonuclease VapC